MYSEFHLRAGALDQNFLNGIKTIFKNKPISVYVEEDLDETDYLLRSPANRKMLEDSIKSKTGYEFSAKDFNHLKKDVKQGKKIDFTKAKKVRVTE